MVDFLLHVGADVSAINDIGQSSLFSATSQDHGITVEAILRDENIDVNLSNSLNLTGTALIVASQRGVLPPHENSSGKNRT